MLKDRIHKRGDPLIRLTSRDICRTGVKRVPRTNDVVDGMPYLEDGRVLDVAAVVWVTGFYPDFDWIKLPELSFDEDGYLVHDRGIVEGKPELYFLGLPFQQTVVSATINGVDADARYIADHLKTAVDTEPAHTEVLT